MSNVTDDRNCYVYVLIHVEAQKVFYVGRGKNDGRGCRREKQHRKCAMLGSSLPVHKEMRRLYMTGQTIKFEVRCTGATHAESVKIEEDLILAYGLDNLTNVLASEGDRKFRERGVVFPASQSSGIRRYNQSISKKVWVRDLGTGEVSSFSSMNEAARALGMNAGTVSYHLNSKRDRYHTSSSRYAFSYSPFPISTNAVN